MKLNLTPIICCDYCNSAAYAEFDCEICKEKRGYSLSKLYGSIEESEIGESYECRCGTRYKLVSKDSWNIEEWEWEINNESKN